MPFQIQKKGTRSLIDRMPWYGYWEQYAGFPMPGFSYERSSPPKPARISNRPKARHI
jgi:hypothetical protein